MATVQRPGGAMASRPLHFFWVLDCSGSMAGAKIQQMTVYEEAVINLGKTVLKVAYGSTFVFMSPSLATKWWHTVARQFEQQHPNVTIQWIPIPGSYVDIVNKLNLLYRTPSTAPDVAELSRMSVLGCACGTGVAVAAGCAVLG